MGRGWRAFARVERLQRTLVLHGRSPDAPLSELAAAAGYADQPHMSREVRSLSGLTPQGPIAQDDGGIPFHLPAADDAPQAPWMQPSAESSLHMTAAVTAAALRLEARHPWVEAASGYCRTALDAAKHLTAHETLYALGFLDAAGDATALQALSRRLPADGRLPVEGGADGETLRLLDLAPRPDSALRRLLNQHTVDQELDQVERAQHTDGGWDFDWQAWAPTVATEWRARLTVDRVTTLQRHHRLPPTT